MTAATATAIYSVYVVDGLPARHARRLVRRPRLGRPQDRRHRRRRDHARPPVAGRCPGQATFFAGLGLVAVGSGLLKANISTMVGHLYDGPDDPRRDGGFTVFYMGINLGAFAAPLVIGTVGEKVNWHLGFALAARRHGAGPGPVPARHPPPERRSSQRRPEPAVRRGAQRPSLRKAPDLAGRRRRLLRRRRSLAGIFTLNWALVPLTIAGLIIPVVVLVAHQARQGPRRAPSSRRCPRYIWFFVAAAVFWMIYDQGGSTLSLFADDKTADTPVRLRLPGLLVPVGEPAVHHGAGPGLRLAVAVRWPGSGKEPSTIVKFALGSGPGRRLVLRLHAAAGAWPATAPRSARCGWSRST